MTEITVYAEADKAAPTTINIRATGDTYRLKDEFRAHGYDWTGSEWIKSVAAAAAKPDVDWLRTIADCRVFVGGRLVHNSATQAA